jgi:hypothetical protein
VSRRKSNRASPDLSSALGVDDRLAGIGRGLNQLFNVTPTNGAEAWADFECSGFDAVPTLQSRRLEFDPDLVRRELYNVEIERVEADEMFFVGIDVIGDKVVEINAESPGGLQAIEHLYKVDICPVVIDALERRTRNAANR